MAKSFTILIVGGYGVFGGRLAELLAGEETLTIQIGGRSAQKAKDFCDARKGCKGILVPVVFDRQGELKAQLAQLHPDIVVDASGPFQDYGADKYALVEACIDAKINYMDLADGSEFVDGVSAFDSRAKAAGVIVLSGVSSFPVLTAAVVRDLSEGWQKVTRITGGIAPSPFAGVGSNVLRAIASYAGQEITVQGENGPRQAHALTETLRYTIAPPGRVPLQNKLFSLVDVPDLRVLPKLWPGAAVWMGAGPVPEIFHKALAGLSWLVKKGVLADLLFMAPLMEFVMNNLRWGEHRGGMFVEAEGIDGAGQPQKKSWQLLAEGADGPYIPSMAVEALLRKMMAGEFIEAGARPASGDLTLQDYYSLFKPRQIFAAPRGEVAADAPLYQHILNDAWNGLPPVIRRMHDVKVSGRAEGVASIRRGRNPLSRFAAFLFGFPPAGDNIPVSVVFRVMDGREKWTRSFGRHSFYTHQYEGAGRSERLIVEKFGPVKFSMALAPEDGKLRLVMRRWSVFGIPLPQWLGARSDSYEFVDDQGRFNFHVNISHPLTGLLVHYQGWLERKE